MQKKVWITSMSKEKAEITALLQLSKKYGLAPDGHFWVDEVDKMAWQAPLDNLLAKDTGLWVISGTKKEFEPQSVRYGLSLLALSIQAVKGPGFPIVITSSDEALSVDDLPFPFNGAQVINLTNKVLGAKLTAAANRPIKKVEQGFRMNIHANQGYGIWFELGPARGDVWDGVLTGGLQSEVTAHGVGPSGELPVKTTLEYQMQGLKLALNNDEYTAWAVKNTIDEHHSYYVRFSGCPGNIIFGPMPDEENEAGFYVLNLA